MEGVDTSPHEQSCSLRISSATLCFLPKTRVGPRVSIYNKLTNSSADSAARGPRTPVLEMLSFPTSLKIGYHVVIGDQYIPMGCPPVVASLLPLAIPTGNTTALPPAPESPFAKLQDHVQPLGSLHHPTLLTCFFFFFFPHLFFYLRSVVSNRQLIYLTID